MSINIWAESNRPKTLDEYVFQSETQEKCIREYVKTKNLPNLFLIGHRGTGKGSLVNVLINELGIQDGDFKKINASKDTSVETVRSIVTSYSKTLAYGNMKIMFLDEMDSMSPLAQSSLKSIIEDETNDGNIRFILSCNNPHKVIPELSSRCKTFKFSKMNKDDMLYRVATILQNENYNVKKPDIKKIKKYIDVYYPDIRKPIIEIQYSIVDGELLEYDEFNSSSAESLENATMISYMIGEGYKMTDDDRDLIYNGVSDEACEFIYGFLADYIDEIEGFSNVETQKVAIQIIAEHLDRHYNSSIKQLTLESCIIKLSEIKE